MFFFRPQVTDIGFKRVFLRPQVTKVGFKHVFSQAQVLGKLSNAFSFATR